MSIHVSRNGAQYGPYELQDVNRMLASGELLAQDSAWQEGMAAWAPLHTLPGVQAPAPAAVAAPQRPGPAPQRPGAAMNPYAAPAAAVTRRRQVGQPRSPGMALLLMIVTLGIYGIVCYYKMFSEIRAWRGKGWSGGQYLLFSLVPVLNLVGVATIWLLPSYIGKLYSEDGKKPPITGLAGWWVFLPLLGGFILHFKIFGHLNKFWVSKGARPV